MKALLNLFDFYAKCMFLIAVLSRLAFATLAVMISLKTENGFLVSPFVEIPFGDYPFYSSHTSENYSNPVKVDLSSDSSLVATQWQNYEAPEDPLPSQVP